MPTAQISDQIRLEYETFGSSDDPTVLLVMGFTAQMIAWDAEFCRAIADRGRHVVRFDNRDCGLSTHLDGVRVDIDAVLAAGLDPTLEMPSVPYLLSDMAADAIGLLDHLGVDRAHIVGASMGGMIVQQMGIDQPDRVASVVSIMSTTGAPDVGRPTPEAMEALLAPPPAGRDDYIAAAQRWSVWASKRYFDIDRARAQAAASYDRAFYPEGASRQLAAILASGDRASALAGLNVPMLVIHGTDDTLITPDGGEHTASCVPGARLMMVDDMGHDMPPALWPDLIEAITEHHDIAAG